MVIMWCFRLGFLLLLTTVGASAQEKGELISVHVKEVHRVQDKEGTEKGTWFHITAIVESKTIIYSIDCAEFYSNETRGYGIECFDLSAGKDYPVRKFQTAISFWPQGIKSTGDHIFAAYNIVSEKEK
jgi:hypothetical protein